MLIDKQSNCASMHNLCDRIHIAYKPKHLYETYESVFDEKNQIDQKKAACKNILSMNVILSDIFIINFIKYIKIEIVTF